MIDLIKKRYLQVHVEVLNHVTLEWRRVPVPVLDHQNEFLFNFRYVGPLVPGEDDDRPRHPVRPHGSLVGVVPMGSAGFSFIPVGCRNQEGRTKLIFFFYSGTFFSDLYRNIIQKIFIIKMGELFLPLKFAHFYIFVYFYTDLF